jgi:hypothetical protein
MIPAGGFGIFWCWKPCSRPGLTCPLEFWPIEESLGIKAGDQMQRYSGIAPITEASGNRQWVHVRFACAKFLRLTFPEFAGSSIRQSERAGAYHEHLRHDQNKPTK